MSLIQMRVCVCNVYERDWEIDMDGYRHRIQMIVVFYFNNEMTFPSKASRCHRNYCFLDITDFVFFRFFGQFQLYEFLSGADNKYHARRTISIGHLTISDGFVKILYESHWSPIELRFSRPMFLSHNVIHLKKNIELVKI